MELQVNTQMMLYGKKILKNCYLILTWFELNKCDPNKMKPHKQNLVFCNIQAKRQISYSPFLKKFPKIHFIQLGLIHGQQGADLSLQFYWTLTAAKQTVGRVWKWVCLTVWLAWAGFSVSLCVQNTSWSTGLEKIVSPCHSFVRIYQSNILWYFVVLWQIKFAWNIREAEQRPLETFYL